MTATSTPSDSGLVNLAALIVLAAIVVPAGAGIALAARRQWTARTAGTARRPDRASTMSMSTSITTPATPSIAVTTALITWATAWAIGQVLSLTVVSVAAPSDPASAPITVILAGTATTWAVCLSGLRLAAGHHHLDDLRATYRLRFRLVDLVGIPAGVLTQLVVVPLVHLPLRAVWPATFNDERIRDNADQLADRAGGIATVLLVVMVVIGAPLVEELVYRGLIQTSLADRYPDAVAVAATATLFTVIHFRPVEYPGLAAFALVVGIAAVLTRRLGASIVTHVAFNATGLALALS